VLHQVDVITLKHTVTAYAFSRRSHVIALDSASVPQIE